MATAIEVASLFSTLGLRMNEREWKKGDDAIERTRSMLGSLVRFAAGAMAGVGFGAAIKSGVKFNANMEETREQVAGMLALSKKTDLADQYDNADSVLKGLQERAKKLPGSLADYTTVLGDITQQITGAGGSMKDLEDITVGAAVAAKSMKVPLDAAARDVNQAIMGQFHSVDQLTGRILGSLGYIGEEGRKRFNSLSKERRLAVLKEAFTQKQLAQLADAQSKTAAGRWDTFKANIVETLGRVAMPLFKSLSGVLATANAWIEKNAAAIDSAANAIGSVLGGALDAVVGILGFLTSGGDEATAVLIGIAATIMGLVVPALFTMAAGWIAAAAPVLAVVAAIAGISYGIIKLIRHWDRVKAAGGRAWDYVKARAQDTWQFIQSIPGRILDAFVGLGLGIVNAIGKAFDWIVARAREVARDIWNTIKDIPVVGRLASGAEAALGGPSSFADIAHAQLNERAAVTSPTFETPVVGGAQRGSTTIGPTTINVNATNMTPDQLVPVMRELVDTRFGEHLRAEDE